MAVKVSSWLKNVLSVRFRTVGLQTPYLADRYSERKESHEELSTRVNQEKI